MAEDKSDVPGDVQERVRQAILLLEARGAAVSVRAVRTEAGVGSKAAERVVRRWRAGELDLAKAWGTALEVAPAAPVTAQPNELVASAETRTREAGTVAAELDELDRELLAKLGRSADPVELARVAAQLAARRFGKEIAAGRTGRGAEELKRSLEEWRRTEAAAISLGRERGEIIARDEAKLVIGEIVARAVRALERYEGSLARQVEEWIADPAFRELPMDERQSAVRIWTRKEVYDVRNMTADELDAELKKAKEELS